jgi:peptidoglycan hydrolase-like protein with peptidoglycan-binding domain
MRLVALVWAVVAMLGLTAPVYAQEQAWIQIEAHPDEATSIDRARAYASLFPETAGFRLGSGWYAVALGPFAPAEAAGKLVDLKAQGLIPADSYITDGTAHGAQFWPVEGAAPLVAPEVTPETVAETETAPAPVIEPEETVNEAKAAEAALSKEERQALQTALQWYGFYTSAIDGSFGAGTRKSMAAWQEANAYEPTGVLTTRQRAALIDGYNADQAEFGFETVTEAESGIEITLPMALIRFDHYEPPFVHYAEKNGSGLRVILISQPGDAAALSGLYDVLQTLSVVPPAGAREKGEKSFTISAKGAGVESYAFAEASNGSVKGYLVVWNPKDADRMSFILPALKASFRGVGDKALDPGLVPLDQAAKSGLMSGLEVRRPKFSRSGFYVDATGSVVTTTEAVAQCAQITLDGSTEASVKLADPATGIAILTPATPLSPPAFARFQTAPTRLGAEVAVAGFSYEDKLPAPVLTFGTLEEDNGLNGETGVSRLAIPTLEGDTGGPVLDQSGSVIAMLLPAPVDKTRQLPAGVTFAAQSGAITALMAQTGLTATTTANRDKSSPDALTKAGLGMTVLVSCWD